MADGMQTNNADVQQAVTAALDAQKKQKKKKRLIILGIIVAIIVVIAVAAGSGSDNSGTASDGGSQQASQKVTESAKGKDGKLGDYVCTVKTVIKCKNWEGKDSIKVVYNYTNNASDSVSFDTALEDKVYQDGIALETTFNSDDDSDNFYDVAIKPGITKEVTKMYLLRNSTSDLEIEVGEWLSFNDAKYTTTVKF